MSDYAREIGSLRIAVEALPEEMRREAWREAFGRALLRLDIEPAADEPLRSRIATQSMPGVAFGRISTSACRIERTAELARDNQDDVGLMAVTRGGVAIFQNGREAWLREGDAIFLHNGSPGTIVFPADTRHFSFSIPAKSLRQLGADPDAAYMTGVAVDRDVLRVILRYARVLLDEETVAPDMHASVASHFRDLAAILLRSSLDPTNPDRSDSVRAARLAAIKADIAENVGANELSVVSVALRHGITPRYVAKLFEADGTTFSQFLLGHRLARAHAMLADPRYDHLTISAVAFEAGFGDLSYFNRVFRRQYGATPSDIRHAARSEGQ